MAPRTRALGLGLLLALWACDKEAPKPAPVASARPSATTPPATSAPSHPPPPRATAAACRAMRVDGEVTLAGSGKAVSKDDALDGRAWIQLGDGAKVALRHTRSARELAVYGPAMLLPCVAGEEQVLLARGRIETTSGLGARPGAEVTIATPLGSVQYADATLVVRATGRQLVVESKAGTASIQAASGTTLAGKAELLPKAKTTVTGTAKPAGAVEACERAAQAAEDKGRLVLGAGDAGPLGERAAAHVAARGEARRACTIAAAAAAGAEEPERGRLLGRVEAADRRWKAVPSRSRGGDR